MSYAQLEKVLDIKERSILEYDRESLRQRISAGARWVDSIQTKQATENVPMKMRTTTGFPTQRRPLMRKLSIVLDSEIDEWFSGIGITIRVIANTLERVARSKRLLYTWKEAFILKLSELRGTDLICYTIDLVLDAALVRYKIRKYLPI